MGHHQQAHDNREKQAQGCIVDVIIPINLVCCTFGTAISTLSSFSFIVFCNNNYTGVFPRVYPWYLIDSSYIMTKYGKITVS